MELLNDHDSFVRIEAIESFTKIIDSLDDSEMMMFIPVLK